MRRHEVCVYFGALPMILTVKTVDVALSSGGFLRPFTGFCEPKSVTSTIPRGRTLYWALLCLDWVGLVRQEAAMEICMPIGNLSEARGFVSVGDLAEYLGR